VYVQPFPPTGAKYQISTDGGFSPLWSPDGKQLYYALTPVARTTRLVAVDIQTNPSFTFGKTNPLPIDEIVQSGARAYDVSPDGKYFVVTVPRNPVDAGKASSGQINVTLNWFEELRQRAPMK
jgi:Tol biopolymer transport system component